MRWGGAYDCAFGYAFDERVVEDAGEVAGRRVGDFFEVEDQGDVEEGEFVLHPR